MSNNPLDTSLIIDWWNENKGSSKFSMIKKSKSLEDLILNTECVKAYYDILKKHSQPIKIEKIFLIIYILSHVKVNTSISIAESLVNNEIKETRLKKIIDLESNQDLFDNIRKIVVQIKGEINLNELINSLYFWGNKTKKELILNYYKYYKN